VSAELLKGYYRPTTVIPGFQMYFRFAKQIAISAFMGSYSLSSIDPSLMRVYINTTMKCGNCINNYDGSYKRKI